MKRSGIAWGVLGVEAAAIFLSVLLGFTVTAWREGRKEDALRRQALENFREELAANQERVAALLPYHAEVGAGFARLQEGPPLASFDEGFQRTGFRGPRVVFFESTALRAADATGALALLDFEAAREVMSVYALQETLEEAQRSLLGAAINPATFDSDNVAGTMVAFTAYFGVVVEMENELAATYPEVLALLDDRLGRASADTAAAR